MISLQVDDRRLQPLYMSIFTIGTARIAYGRSMSNVGNSAYL